ncbi:MAG: cyclopropane fatty-acyl-phospholipid synthase-like methyltransferase [Cognaticolwellia sp.]|jgi:cyclopropane fatty-acyl-phospholipid synthase-like methyltransferase
MNKPFSQACENNKTAILLRLVDTFRQSKTVLEVGSGTGQHAVYFAPNMTWLSWQTSDIMLNHQGISQWLKEYPAGNLLHPVELDLNQPWPIAKVDAIYTANTLHIVSWPLVQAFFSGVTQHLNQQGKLCIYGPFNYQGKYTSESNADFDIWLKERDSQSAIRDIEAIIALAESAGLSLEYDHDMPANNRLLEFSKID